MMEVLNWFGSMETPAENQSKAPSAADRELPPDEPMEKTL